MQVSDKLMLLRSRMDAAGVDACIIPSGDPHLSEYPADHWKVREWLSEFTGSAGTLVVTREEAALWTDSRYYLQAEEQLDELTIQLFRDGQPGIPDYASWLCEVLMPGDKVAVNGANLSITQLRTLTRQLRTGQIQIDSVSSVAEDIWASRPIIPEDTIFMHDDDWAGKTRAEKLLEIREIMKKEGATHYITAALDEVAWTLNLRGTDVLYNPVFHAYLIIEHDQAKLFVNPHKLTAQIAQKLAIDDVKVYLYDDFYKHIKDQSTDAAYFIDADKINSAIFAALSPKSEKKEGLSIITRLKACKNAIELNHLKETLINDGVAMVQFMYWLEENVVSGKVSEVSAAKKLKSFRAGQQGFMGESFGAISAYGPHGAIVHYNANAQTDAVLKPEGIYLIDSGGQYLGGTTDITRTIALGTPSQQAKEDFTLVLKGHIALANAIFPAGSRGVHLDILARKALWEKGLNYGHGTGHGIGYFLNVHEGPQNIRPQDNGIELKPGMVSSNEPGLYRQGEYGIRIENLILCKEKYETEFGKFLEFETLTLCPIDKTLIEKSLMTSEEIAWLNQYHQRVFDVLKAHLTEAQAEWLKNKTSALE